MFLFTVDNSNGLGIVDNDLKGLQMASRQWKITTQQTWEKSLQYVIFGKVYKQKKFILLMIQSSHESIVRIQCYNRGHVNLSKW